MKHSTDIELKNYYAHMLNPEEELALLEHIAQCEYCVGRFAKAFPEEELITPPPNLYDEILAKRPRVLCPSAKWEFYRYSAKVVFAVGMALFFLLYNDFTPSSDWYLQKDVVIMQEQPEEEDKADKKNIISSALQASSSAAGQALEELSGQLSDRIFGKGSR